MRIWMFTKMLQRRKCLFLTGLLLVIQTFYIVGRNANGSVVLSVADELAAAEESGPTEKPSRVEIVKAAFAQHDVNITMKSLQQGRWSLIEKFSDHATTSNTALVSEFASKQLDSSRNGGKVAPTPVIRRSIDSEVYTVLVTVPSVPAGFDKRHLIRETWFKKYRNSSLVALRFVLGTYNLSHELLEQIDAENRQYQDLVLLEDLLDSYNNLTRKTLYTFIWSAYNMRFLYLFKCDDDTYPLLSRMLYELHERGSVSRLYWGYFLTNAPVRRTGKWKDKEWSLGKHYVKFAIGGAYVISSDLIDLLVNNALYLQLFTNEDVAVGLWLASFDIERKSDERFCRFFHAQECKVNANMALGVSDDDILYLSMNV